MSSLNVNALLYALKNEKYFSKFQKFGFSSSLLNKMERIFSVLYSSHNEICGTNAITRMTMIIVKTK